MTADTVSIRKQATNSKEPETSLHRKRCERCNVVSENERASGRELVLNTIFFFLLLAILASADYLAAQWIEQYLDRPLWHPLWHESLDDWGLLPDLSGKYSDEYFCWSEPKNF
jgi:hypothetical protein